MINIIVSNPSEVEIVNDLLTSKIHLYRQVYSDIKSWLMSCFQNLPTFDLNHFLLPIKT
ncbi:MAG: hypothetical protein ACJA0E_000881 [Bermanella sp.]|jgi:hypothetical protein